MVEAKSAPLLAWRRDGGDLARREVMATYVEMPPSRFIFGACRQALAAFIMPRNPWQ